MAYYYLVASLPTLTLDGDLPWALDEFLGACENALGPEDLEGIRLLVAGREAEAAHPIIGRWVSREAQLRNAVARHRAARLGVEAGPFQREHSGFSVEIERGVAEAMAQPDPLGRERALDSLRWGMAEDLAAGDPFGFGAVASHGLRLRLAARWQSMREPEGRRVLFDLVDGRLEAMTSGLAWGAGGAG
ncbi:MAG: hypothetical protein IT577_21985 [Verrucomicrobiae bacterium]|nr:hypothetical protein [Verrucomicrobiae bacterium]